MRRRCGQILEYGSAGAQVEMTHLAIAHLPHGQPDRAIRCLKLRMRPLSEQRTPVRHVRRRHRVIVGPLADAKAVQDDQNQRPRPRGLGVGQLRVNQQPAGVAPRQ